MKNFENSCYTDLYKIQFDISGYLPLLGEKDDIPMIFARIVPANPFHSCNFIIPMLEINEQDAYRRGIQMDDGEMFHESDLCTDTKCYPLINNTSLHFIVRLQAVCYAFYPKLIT